MILRLYQLMLGHWLSCLPLHTSSKVIGFFWMVTTFIIPRPPMFFVPLHKHPFYKTIREKLIEINRQQLSLPKAIKSLKFFQEVCSKEHQQTIKNFLKIQHKSFFPKYLLQPINSLLGFKKKPQLMDYFQVQAQRDSNKYSQLFERQYQPFVLKIFAKVAGFILDCEKYPEISMIPIFLSGHASPHRLKQRQVLYILSLMFFNLVPVQNYHQNAKSKQFNYTNNFSFIFNHQPYKTRVILEFMKLIFFEDQACLLPKRLSFDRNFLIKRQVVHQNLFNLIQRYFDAKMLPLQILKDTDSIEQFYGEAKIDFANRYIGGGALRKGCVQEEIMYANHPQLYATIVLCESMKQNQSLRYEGFSKFFKNQGYGYQTQFGGRQILNDKREVIVAIDAFDFSKDQQQQYTEKFINREILKAFSGFKNNNSKFIVTGNWGCGVFKGDLKLKLIIQWIAASMANKQLKYCPYGKNKQLNEDKQILTLIQNLSLGPVYQALIAVSKNWTVFWKRYAKKPFMDVFYDEIQKYINLKRQIEAKAIKQTSIMTMKLRSSMQQFEKTKSFLDEDQNEERRIADISSLKEEYEKSNYSQKYKEMVRNIVTMNLSSTAGLFI